MKMFRKQTARAPLTTVLLVLLLALSIAASSIGFAAWVGARKQFEEIDSQYTTIGIHAGMNYADFVHASSIRYHGNDSMTFQDGKEYIGPLDANYRAKQSPDYIAANQGILLSAHIDGSTAITSGTMDISKYCVTLDGYCYSLSVMAVRCVDVSYYPYLPEHEDFIRYLVTFEIVDAVCRMDVYDLPPEEDTISLAGDIYTRDGEMPFDVGKTYLIRGEYADYPIGLIGGKVVTDENGKTYTAMEYGRESKNNGSSRGFDFDFGNEILTSSSGEMGIISGPKNFTKEKRRYPDSELCYYTTPINCWPYYAEYEGDWRTFLDTEEGAVWRDEIIPNFEINHESAAVILTDNLDTMYNFSIGDASILEGRKFAENEYHEGSNVCLVSASYAQLNNLSVGDTIKLDYYDTGYNVTRFNIGTNSGRVGTTVVRRPLTEDTRMDIVKDYEIIGIYTAPEWASGMHSFHADTIFVPKASVPGMDNYGGHYIKGLNTYTIPMLNSIVIRNGSIDKFEAFMEEDGKGGVYHYFDQGYTEAATTVQTLIDNAMRLMLVGVAMFMLASMLFLLLFARRVSAVMRSMRLLGVPKRKTWLESLGMLAMQEVIAVLLGNGLAVILYDRITAQLLSGTPALDITSIALCAGVQLALLIAAGGVWMHRIAGSNLMQKSEGGKLLWNKNKAASCGA